MWPADYPRWVKTIEVIRFENLMRLIDEIQARDRLSSDRAIAEAVGISGAYLSQLRSNVRGAINSAAARKIERKTHKPEGWMDTDFDLWPFPDKSLLEMVEALDREPRIEVQGAIRRALADLRTSGTKEAGGKLSGSSSTDSARHAA